MTQRFYPSILIFAVASAAGCGGNLTPGVASYSATQQAAHIVVPDAKTPILISLDIQSGQLIYWPIQPGGGTQPKPLSASLGIYASAGLVANGNVVAIANYRPAEVVTYNVRSKATNVLSDPYGNPVDIAIDKHGTIYSLHFANVSVFKAGTSQPGLLSCPTVTQGDTIAADNEGNVYVNGYGNHFMGVIEYPKAAQPCRVVHLRAEQGYAGGVLVNPKTDALLVVDNPDLCAGGLEGRMIIYPKPYLTRTARRRNLNASYCAGEIRLDAASNSIFVQDYTVSAGFPLIDQETYPGAKLQGVYQDYSGPSASFSGFTTIPNTLPN